MSNLSIIVGTRGSNRLGLAIERAVKPIEVLCPSEIDAADVRRSHPGVKVLSGSPEAAKAYRPTCRTVILHDAHKIRTLVAVNVMGGTLDRGQTVIMTGCTPTSRDGEWFAKVVESGEYEVERAEC